jgi:hypothetical protein
MCPGRNTHVLNFISPVLCLLCLCCRFVVDHASCVCFPCVTITSEARCLRKLERIAIWNRDRFVLAISTGIWMADIALLIHGKYLLQNVCERGDMANITGVVQVNFQFRLSWISLVYLTTVGPLYVVARDRHLHCAQLGEHFTFYPRNTLYRHCVTCHHAHWLVPHACQRSRRVKLGTFPLEAGAKLPVLAV